MAYYTKGWQCKAQVVRKLLCYDAMHGLKRNEPHATQTLIGSFAGTRQDKGKWLGAALDPVAVLMELIEGNGRRML